MFLGFIGHWNFGLGGNPFMSLLGGDLDLVTPPWDSACTECSSIFYFVPDFTFQSQIFGIVLGFH